MDSAERGLFLQACFALPLTAIVLRLAGFRRVCAILAGLTHAGGHLVWERSQALTQADAAGRMVQLAAQNCLIHTTCLHRSLTLWWLLRRQGIESDLRIGVRKEGGQFQAHAWVEYQGAPLNEAREVHRRFVAFDRPLMSAPEQKG